MDGTLGPRANLSGNMTVPASMGTQRGANLFHSFGTFNIFSGESLYFTSTGSSAAISNVISRVTGGSGSTINGVLGSTIPGANLFLVNPAGIVFGSNAQLDVSGSFYASTANYLKLADGGRFDATMPANTSLTVAAPAAFGFLGAPLAPITVNGTQLAVPVGKTLGLIGGDITVKDGGLLEAPSGTVHLVSAASRGEATFTPGAFDVSSFTKLGEISVRGGSSVEVSEPTGQNSGGGTVYIRGGAFTLDDSLILATTDAGDSGGLDLSISGDARLANEAEIDTASPGAGRAGDIAITATGTMSMNNATLTSLASGDGNAGDIRIRTRDLALANGALIESGAEASGIGRGGAITIGAAGTVSLDGTSIIESIAFGPGRAGNIRINATRLALATRSYLSTAAFGDGNAGNIRIAVRDLALTGRAYIDSGGAEEGLGLGGNITIDAARTISLDGVSTIESIAYGPKDGGGIRINTTHLALSNESYLSTAALRDGNAGSIQIGVRDLALTNHASIDSSGAEKGRGRGGNITIDATRTVSLDGESTIESIAYGPGRAGSVQINTTHLALANRSYISTEALSAGHGGNIAISASGSISMNNRSFIASVTFDDGNAGNIRIAVRDLALTGRAYIDSGGAEAGLGLGGNITIDATRTVSLDGISTIESIAYGRGDGGGIRINTPHLALANGSYLSTAVFGRGKAGNIQISTRDLALTNHASIDSDVEPTGSGRGGTITIDAAGAVTIDGGSGIESIAYGPGPAGSVRINATRLALANDSYISTETQSTKRGGSIFITGAGSIALDGASQIKSSSLFGATGQGGTIAVLAGNALTMLGGSRIRADSTGAGDAGSISVDAGSKVLLDGSSIATSTRNAAGGGINVVAKDLIYLRNSTISSSVQGGTGDGGNIFIDPTFLVLNNSSIIANAFGGDGGNITINAGNLFQSPNSVIDASSELGISGSVVISSPIVDLSGGLVALPASYLDTSALLANQCAARMAGNASSLVLAGRGGLPAEPEGWLSGAGSIGSPSPRSAAVSPAEHHLVLPLLASSRPFECVRQDR